LSLCGHRLSRLQTAGHRRHLAEQQPMLERAEPYIRHPARVREIVDAGTDRARKTAQTTMVEVRAAMGLNY